MNRYIPMFLASCLALTNLLASSEAGAVGPGLDFHVTEGAIPGAQAHNFDANSLDLTYHACTQVVGQNLTETGYFWVSSYQDKDSVVDSQINHFLNNGYHIYGIYNYQAQEVGPRQMAIGGDRLNYEVTDGSINLYIDPDKDTILDIVECQVTVADNGDDASMGDSVGVLLGAKSETDGVANGDFKVVFNNWTWDPVGYEIIHPFTGFVFDTLVFNGNLTVLGGPLGANHDPEGSGNIYWLQGF